MSPRAWAFAVAAAVLAVHLSALGAGYVQDDHLLVESNPLVARGSVREIAAAAYWEEVHPVPDRALWRPVPILTYALERRLSGGPSPALSHGVNLVLHAGVALLLFTLIRLHRATAGTAAWGALAFGLHPAKSEAVFNVVGRAEIFSAGFGLLALVLAARARGPVSRRRRILSWSAAAALFLALASKESAAIFVPLLVFQDRLLPREGPEGRSVSAMERIGALAPCLVALTVFAVVRTLALEAWFQGQTVSAIDNVLVGSGAAERVSTAFALVARSLGLLLLPVGLSLDYSGEAIGIVSSWTEPSVGAGLAVLALLAVALAFGWRAAARGDRAGALVALGAAAAALPFLVVGQFLFPVGALFAERFLYLPMLGVGLLLAGFGSRFGGRRGLRGIAAVLLVLWGAGTWRRGFDWKDDATAFAEALRQVPASPRAAFALAKLRADAIVDPARAPAETDAARSLFDRAIANWDDYPEAWKEKGLLLARAGRLVEAEEVLRGAVRRGPSSVNARFNLALVLQRLGRPAEAEREFRKAVLHDPGHSPSWASLGHLAFSRGDREAAAWAYGRAVALGRRDLLPRLEELRRGAENPGLPPHGGDSIMGDSESP